MPIKSEEEADYRKIKTKHRDATYNVYAYVVGKIVIFKDLGMMEPQGLQG